MLSNYLMHTWSLGPGNEMMFCIQRLTHFNSGNAIVVSTFCMWQMCRNLAYTTCDTLSLDVSFQVT